MIPYAQQKLQADRLRVAYRIISVGTMPTSADLARLMGINQGQAHLLVTKTLRAKVLCASYTVPPTGGRVAQFSVCADEDALEAMIGAMTRQRVQQPMKIGRIRSVFDLGALYA